MLGHVGKDKQGNITKTPVERIKIPGERLFMDISSIS
jgi:hypothetical protein